MIETFLSKVWKEHIDSLSRSKKDKDSLKDHNRWTTYHHIEILAAMNKMENTGRDLMNQLRQKRNSIIHERKEADEREAYHCLNVADKILRNRINNPNMPFIDIDKVPF
jgi:hypothetical protein